MIDDIRDINPHFEKKIIDPHQYNLPCSEDRLDFYDSTAYVKPINFIGEKPQINHLMFQMNPHTIHLSFANPIQQSHSLHSDFYGEIAKLPTDLFFREEPSCEEYASDNICF